VLGAHNARLDRVRALRTKKGRREQGRFPIEGATLLDEAARSGIAIEELYGTPAALEASAAAAALESRGIPVYRIDDRAMGRLSDLETSPGLLAVAAVSLRPVADLFSSAGLVLTLAGVSDPGNAGTLLRAAEAFGASGVVFDPGAVEPHAPKVVRAAMGSLFRLRLAVASAQETAEAARGWEITGLDLGGERIDGLAWATRSLLVVGQERHGLGDWKQSCTRLAAIPTMGKVESLNASVAGGIALYQAGKRMPAGASEGSPPEAVKRV
jgi:TrmH family RNA methyltransferase